MIRRFIWFCDFIFRCSLAKANYHLEEFKHQTLSNLIRQRYTLNSKITNTSSRWSEMNKHRSTLKKTLPDNNLLNPCLHFTEAINKVNRELKGFPTTSEYKSNIVVIKHSIIFPFFCLRGCFYMEARQNCNMLSIPNWPQLRNSLASPWKVLVLQVYTIILK